MNASRKRPYRKGRRAEAEEDTRRRITEAAVALHGSIGPANTKLTDVAELAGVSRMTVYNHFPTETDLFVACSTHWASQNPFPDPSSWTDMGDAGNRLRVALRELYEWYDQKQGMLGPVLRDARVITALAEVMVGQWDDYLVRVVDALASGWPGPTRRSKNLRASLRLAADFHTWRILTDAGLSSNRASVLAAKMVTCGAARGA